MASLPGSADRPVLVTGGAGFVGTNLADRLVRSGRRVVVLDDLSRAGVDRNLEWLKATHGDAVTVEIGDVRDRDTVNRVVGRASAVFHLAAQVAVTTSLTGPRHDFEVNALGTFNLLEAVRAQSEPPPLLFSSTNKVYGSLSDLSLDELDDRYEPSEACNARGVRESRPLDFHSPYGCSKGAADQYVLDYGRSYGLRTAVFRMSCIYGPHQCGTEDQGWVAHFLLAARAGRPITLYGTGKQVRDILFVEDLVEAFVLGLRHIDRLSAEAYNIGGGAGNAVSLRQVLRIIEQLTGRPVQAEYGPWRTGDQPWYVSDTGRFRAATGWSPKVGFEEGIGRLNDWFDGRVRGTAEPAPLRTAGARLGGL
ncbi:MAG TPA: SDR family NAD(P)-dependent oxidoreductase [Azospirillaceae bacterium]|nr:SDR family NAD(P)-dependent oxidoreductase [Azospirillaceae bacterium]